MRAIGDNGRWTKQMLDVYISTFSVGDPFHCFLDIYGMGVNESVFRVERPESQLLIKP